jgi:hypothetical protein
LQKWNRESDFFHLDINAFGKKHQRIPGGWAMPQIKPNGFVAKTVLLSQ